MRQIMKRLPFENHINNYPRHYNDCGWLFGKCTEFRLILALTIHVCKLQMGRDFSALITNVSQC